MIKHGNNEIQKRYIGDKEVLKTYIGDTLVMDWSSESQTDLVQNSF